MHEAGLTVLMKTSLMLLRRCRQQGSDVRVVQNDSLTERTSPVT